MKSKTYDVVIVGAGPAGLTAGIFAIRRALKIIILHDPGYRPTPNEATIVDDWIGTPHITGPRLMKKFRKHAELMGVPIEGEKVKGIEKAKDGFSIIGEGKVFEAKTVILATGAMHRRAEVPGEKEFTGRGVSYCANCEGPFFRGKKVLIAGGGDTAATYALLLHQIGADTTLIHRRDELRAVESYQKQLANSKVRIIWNSVIKEIKGGKFVKSVVVEDLKTHKLAELPMDGVFIAIGSVPMSEMVKGLDVKVNPMGYIAVDKEGRTNVPGLFAAGDIADNPTKRIVTACADGSKAAEAAYMYVQEKKLMAGQSRGKK